ncbi:unnamed protein product [Clonostachys solani]|uniref:Uncharacterized protein n=1 Tax=Clonostachys solani TaxID=160281 RepID=A0A9N9W212_9HYPO|nr:unnamed protein product [Clonostachys solani]
MDNPSAQCPILQLAPEVILLFTNELPDHAKVLLSQTCRDLRQILRQQGLPPLSAREHVRLLVHLSRANPHVWACATCKARHRVTRNDLWGDQRLSSCPRLTVPWRPGGFFAVNHVRVQLALKYTRLGMHSARIRSYLKRLLRYEGGVRMVKDGRGLNIFVSSSRPRVVAGRFLVKYTWEYALDSASSAPTPLPMLVLCHHQKLARPAEGVVWGEERKQLVRAVEGALSDDLSGVEYCRSCPFCPTDFAVRIFDEGMVIEAWKDFGPEDGPGNPTWRSHSSTEARRNPSDFGRVRRLYYGVLKGGPLS